MSQMQVVRAEMMRAADVARDSADEARALDSSGHLSTATAALPGADCVSHLLELGTSWDDQVDAWADDVAGFAEDLRAHTDDVTGTDSGAGGLLGGLGGLIGGEED
ncbi:hypothetical protein [Nocardioides deserti]|uniref:Excreted virulence factor EspC (Type VII ESX diderm) n=1 Tax=Nocardioides deserti TaxID=1588644 RepID=A0ABR6UB31_9ACTN|nr:hypothetical protein [Nocardioides deserti]MBC2961580.1 hypothetical protein [Nocardioides deserti]GGO78102.1 hypothetical protein GCM10012276_34720 [Nocardioides deserti]